MRGIAFAFVAITFVASNAAPGCCSMYGPECDRRSPARRPLRRASELPFEPGQQRAVLSLSTVRSRATVSRAPIPSARHTKASNSQAHPYQGQHRTPGAAAHQQPMPSSASFSADLSTACLSSTAPTTHGLRRHAAWHCAAGRDYRPTPPDGRIEVRTRGHKDSKGDKVCRSPASTRPEQSHRSQEALRPRQAQAKSPFRWQSIATCKVRLANCNAC